MEVDHFISEMAHIPNALRFWFEYLMSLTLFCRSIRPNVDAHPRDSSMVLEPISSKRSIFSIKSLPDMMVVRRRVSLKQVTRLGYT